MCSRTWRTSERRVSRFIVQPSLCIDAGHRYGARRPERNYSYLLLIHDVDAVMYLVLLHVLALLVQRNGPPTALEEIHMTFDTIIVGGSFSGLSAALYLARARPSVLVLDLGAPRNRFASTSPGFFSQRGSAPTAMIQRTET